MKGMIWLIVSVLTKPPWLKTVRSDQAEFPCIRAHPVNRVLALPLENVLSNGCISPKELQCGESVSHYITCRETELT